MERSARYLTPVVTSSERILGERFICARHERLVVLAGVAWRGRADGLITRTHSTERRAGVLYRSVASLWIYCCLVAPGTQGHGHAGPDGFIIDHVYVEHVPLRFIQPLVEMRESDKVVTVRNACEFIVEEYLSFSKLRLQRVPYVTLTT